VAHALLRAAPRLVSALGGRSAAYCRGSGELWNADVIGRAPASNVVIGRSPKINSKVRSTETVSYTVWSTPRLA
jgi:hypothetical protein